jgi:hypothetical protein
MCKSATRVLIKEQHAFKTRGKTADMRVASPLNFGRFLFSVCFVGFSLAATSWASASTSMSPAVIRGSILTYAASNAAGYGGDLAYGTPIKFQTMSVGVPNPDPVSCHGERCFALGLTGDFQFPAVSSDHGRTWRIGGHWFAGAWADAAAFSSQMTALSPTVAVAWVPMQNTGFYSTSTAGRKWYAVVWPGNVASVTGSHTGEVITVTIAGFDSTRFGKILSYSSPDGGLVWRLDH